MVNDFKKDPLRFSKRPYSTTTNGRPRTVAGHRCTRNAPQPRCEIPGGLPPLFDQHEGQGHHQGALVDARHGNCGSDPDAIHVRSELGQLLRQIGLAPGPAISPAASTSLTRQTKSASSQTRPNLSSLG
jgi:hypothetical protein